MQSGNRRPVVIICHQRSYFLKIAPGSERTLRMRVRQWAEAVPCRAEWVPAQSCLPLRRPTGCSPPAPLSVGCSRQGYWSGLPFPPLGDLPNPGTKTTVSCVSCIGRWTLVLLSPLKSPQCYTPKQWEWFPWTQMSNLSLIPCGTGLGCEILEKRGSKLSDLFLLCA